MNDLFIRDLIETTNASYRVVIYYKSSSSHCRKSKDFFAKHHVRDVKIIDLDQEPHGEELLQGLADYTGQGTLPNIFVQRQHIGGNSNVQKTYANGNLEELLEELQHANWHHARNNVSDLVAREIKANQVVVFSKSYCPLCAATNKLFNDC